jgi:hypothetical protein
VSCLLLCLVEMPPVLVFVGLQVALLHFVLHFDPSLYLLFLRLADALLPRVAAFISQFPAYRQIVVYCARKTEVGHNMLVSGLTRLG